MTARYRPLWLILGLFLLPLAIGGGLFAYGWRPAAPAANGDLLNPARTLPELLGADGRPLDPATFTDHWTLLIASAGPCEDACRQWIVATRQVHVALYKQMNRVQRVWLTDQPHPDATPLLTLQPDLHTAIAASEAARQRFDLDRAGPQVFVVDPQGRLILRYAADADPRGLLKDMERLLRYAWAG